MTNTPQRIGNYNIDRRIGKGGQSEVWLGRHRSLENRLVAIKLLMSQDQEWASRFGREAAITSNLRHENIVQIFDHGHQGSFYYTIMEYVEDGSLRDLLKTRGKLPLDQALQIYRCAGEALDHAHAHGVIHRDVSTGNILVEQHSGRVLLADFGIARESGKSGDTTFNKVMGTPGYLSPEHAQSATAVTQLSDLYALGVVLFEMLSGELPWNHNPGMPDASGGPFVPIKTLRDAGLEGLPSDVDRVIQTMLALEPTKRYPTAAAAIQDLERVLNRHTSPTQVVGGKAAPNAGPSVLAPPPEPHPVETVLGLDLLKGPMQRAQQRADQLSDPAGIAAIFNAWSTRGRLRRQMLGRQAVLHRVSSSNMYFYTLDVLYETREPAKTIVEPDRAAVVLPNEKQIDRWGVELPAPKEFADEAGGTVRLPGSTRVIKCDACDGIGRIECAQCKGSGRVSDLSTGSAPLKPVSVGANSPAGQAQAGGASAAISTAVKPGASAAARLVPCAACNGTGRLPCKQCAGEGRLLERKQTMWSRRADTYSGHETLPVNGDWLRRVCEPLEVYRERQSGDVRPEWQHIPALNDLLVQAQAHADNNTKIELSEVTISLIPITEVLFDLDALSVQQGQSSTDEELYSWYICGFENQLQDDWRFLNWARVGVIVLSALAGILLALLVLLIIIWR